MSGEISVREHDWKAEIIMLALVFGVAFAFTSLVVPMFDLTPFLRGALGALIAYVIARVGYKALYPDGLTRRIAWELTDTELLLDGKSIPRATIRAVHCWPNRDAFGHSHPGWVVNIETGHKNTLLRSVSSGEDADASAAELAALVRALGGQVPAS